MEQVEQRGIVSGGGLHRDRQEPECGTSLYYLPESAVLFRRWSTLPTKSNRDRSVGCVSAKQNAPNHGDLYIASPTQTSLPEQTSRDLNLNEKMRCPQIKFQGQRILRKLFLPWLKLAEATPDRTIQSPRKPPQLS